MKPVSELTFGVFSFCLLQNVLAQIDSPIAPLPGAGLPKAPKVPVPVSSATTVIPSPSTASAPKAGDANVAYGGFGKGHAHGRRQVQSTPKLPVISPPPSPPVMNGGVPPKIPIPVSTASSAIPSLANDAPKAGQTDVAYGSFGKAHAHEKRQVNPAATLPKISPPPSPVLPSDATPKLPIPVSTPLPSVLGGPKAGDANVAYGGLGKGHSHGRRQANPAATLPKITPTPAPVLPSGATPKIPIPVSTPLPNAMAGPKAGDANVAYGGLGKGHSHGKRQVNPASTLPKISPPPSPVLPSGATPKIPVPVSTDLPAGPAFGLVAGPKAGEASPAASMGMMGKGHSHGRRQENPASTLPKISPSPTPVLPSGAPRIPVPVSTNLPGTPGASVPIVSGTSVTSQPVSTTSTFVA